MHDPAGAMRSLPPVPGSWISRRASAPQAVRRKLGHLAQVAALLDAMQPGDELRSYSSPRAGWARRAGVRGYVVVRCGEVVDRVVTART
jgi:hypothetical protein